jgi:lipopolysaccharide heptosyltransferase I
MNLARTLIIKPSSMGDVVQALPVLTALAEAAPRARVSWLVARPFAGLLEGHPRLAEVIVFDRHRFGRIARSFTTTLEFLRFLKGLRQRRFTTVLDLQGLFRSGLFALSTGAPNRIGFAHARELAPLFYTAEVRVRDPEMHAVDRYLEMVRFLRLPPPEATDHLPVSAGARAAARGKLEEAGLAPGAAYAVVCAHARWETKQWPADRYARVVGRLAEETGARSVLVGSADAADDARAILEAANGDAADGPALDLTGRTTLKELVAVIAEGRVMVTNDSGPMHVAAAVGTPVVALFGPTNPRRTGPAGRGHTVLAGRAPCSPCYRRRCLYAGGTEALRCLRNIGADEVAELVIEAWARPEPGAGGTP